MDSTGRFTVVAVLTSVDGQFVELERQRDGKVIRVPISRLCHRDREYIESTIEESLKPIDKFRKMLAAIDGSESAIADVYHFQDDDGSETRGIYVVVTSKILSQNDRVQLALYSHLYNLWLACNDESAFMMIEDSAGNTVARSTMFGGMKMVN